jgi:uncharacterized protein
MEEPHQNQPAPHNQDNLETVPHTTPENTGHLLKSSRYNIYFEVKGEPKYALFNTLSRSIVAVDQDLKDVLEKGDVNALELPIKESLRSLGVLISSDLDERNVFEFRHCTAKYRSEEACFVIFPTYGCNLRCPYCYEGTEKLSVSMDDTTVENTVNFIKRAAIENRSRAIILGLYGGEPLLYPDVCCSVAAPLSEWAAQNNMVYYGTLTTNGTLLNEKTAHVLQYVASVHITVDGTEDMHNKVRVYANGKGSYKEVMRAVEFMKDKPHHLTIRIHVNMKNGTYKGLELLDELEQMGLKGRPNLHIYFKQLEPPDVCLRAALDEDYLQRKERELNEFPLLWKKAQEKGWGPHMSVGAGEEHGILTFNIVSCDHLKKAHYVVDPFGDVYLCPMSAGMKHHSIGTLQKGGVLDYSPVYYTLLTRDPLQLKGCNTCAYLPICSAGCPISIFEEKHSYMTPYCGSLKRLKEAAIKSHLRNTYPDKFGGVI